MMTLDGAIKHAEEVAENKGNQIKTCIECAEEHRQLAEWLKDYKRLLEQKSCGDAVSRKDLERLKRWRFSYDTNTTIPKSDLFVRLTDIRALPSVKPVACIAKVNFSKGDMQEIVDDKVEELRTEKHTDRQIYDVCILLMQKMVDYFQEYLEYLGYDLDKLDEDERFAVGISNMEIVRQLFLYRTRNSGGCSTRDFCEKLGVSPYESVKFEFEESEEE